MVRRDPDFFMFNAISPNPSVPSENAYCQQAPVRWIQAAWALGRDLLRGPVRAHPDDRALVSDLVARGLVERRGSGWLRITESGRAQFPANRCWEYPLENPDCSLGSRALGLGVACDWRLHLLARSASASLCRPCKPPVPARRSRVPQHVVRSAFTTNVAEFDDPKRETVPFIPSLEDTIRRAPKHDQVKDGGHWWPEVGPTDAFPATRIGYPTGPRIERSYA